MTPDQQRRDTDMTAKPIPDYVNDFFRADPRNNRFSLRLASGHSLSVQASAAHYCTPRENNAELYTSVEVFCWTTSDGRPPAAFKPYGASRDQPAAYVPVEVVNRYIHHHGGIRVPLDNITEA